MSIAEIKKSARGAAAKRRAEAHAALKDEAGLALAARGLPDGLANRRGIVSGFIPYKSEITTLPLMTALLRRGWQTALPVVIAPEQPLVFRAWSPGDRLEPGVWDIPVPLDDRARSPAGPAAGARPQLSTARASASAMAAASTTARWRSCAP